MATLQTTVIDDTGFIRLASGTTGERPATPSTGMLRYNTTISAPELYNGTAWVRFDGQVTATDTGSTYSIDIEDQGIPYKIHTWYGAGTLVVTTPGEVEYMIVAGGGGGAGGNPSADGNGGGGAGGFLQGRIFLTAGTYPITVGGGGAGGAASSNSPGGDGTASTAFGLTAVGGGGGGSDGSLNGRAGGSGGGASTSGVGGVGGAGTAGQGNTGGLANAPGGGGPGGGGGGGGGAAGVGGAGNQNQPGGIGGAGITSTFTGKLGYYAAGGGGSSWTGVGGSGGINTAGSGGSRTGAYRGWPGAERTGSGGGAGTAGNASGPGGSGMVAARYVRTSGLVSLPIDIPTDDLVYHLDAGNPLSYNFNTVAGRTVWKDLSGRNTNFTLSGTPTMTGRFGGGIVFDGTVYGESAYDSVDMDFRYGQTIIGWFEPTNNTGRRNLHGQAYAGSGTLTHEPAGDITYFFGTGGENNSPYVGVSSTTFLAGEGPMFYAVSRNQRHDVVQWYKNGTLSSTTTAGGYNLTTNSTSRIRLGLDYTGAYWVGNWYIQICYNRGLGQREIEQIYNATRARFGK